MTNLLVQIAIIVVLTLLNGLFAMSETALVSSSKARLRQRADAGDRKAHYALQLANSPNRFLSTVQIGISLIGVLAGAVGGATIAEPLAGALSSAVPGLAPYAGAITFGVVVAFITYLSLILGELVPKRLALNGAETIASRVAGPMRFLSTLASPAVWFLGVSTDAVLRFLRVRPSAEPPVSEREVEILLEEGAHAGVFEDEESDLAQRALRLDDRPIRALMTPRPNIVWLSAGTRTTRSPGAILTICWAWSRSKTPLPKRSEKDGLSICWDPCGAHLSSRKALPLRRRSRRSSDPSCPWPSWSTSAAISRGSSRRPTSSRPSLATSRSTARRL